MFSWFLAILPWIVGIAIFVLLFNAFTGATT